MYFKSGIDCIKNLTWARMALSARLRFLCEAELKVFDKGVMEPLALRLLDSSFTVFSLWLLLSRTSQTKIELVFQSVSRFGLDATFFIGIK